MATSGVCDESGNAVVNVIISHYVSVTIINKFSCS